MIISNFKISIFYNKNYKSAVNVNKKFFKMNLNLIFINVLTVKINFLWMNTTITRISALFNKINNKKNEKLI